MAELLVVSRILERMLFFLRELVYYLGFMSY